MSLFERISQPETEIEALYVYLTPQSKAKLAKLVPPSHPQKSGDHVTLVFQPSEEEIARFRKQVGKGVVLTATHVVETDRVQAVKVRGVKTQRGTPHITISWASGAKPVESNDAVKKEAGTPLQPWIKLQGVYDYFPGTLNEEPTYRRIIEAVDFPNKYASVPTATTRTGIGTAPLPDPRQEVEAKMLQKKARKARQR